MAVQSRHPAQRSDESGLHQHCWESNRSPLPYSQLKMINNLCKFISPHLGSKQLMRLNICCHCYTCTLYMQLS